MDRKILLTCMSIGLSAGHYLHEQEALLRHDSGQPTINGGRKMFKQNKRQQAKRNR